MAFNVEIQNFGKLDNTKVRIGGFTVFAGPNNTGKSSVSKLLYSLFDGMNENHSLFHFNDLVSPLRKALRILEDWEDEDMQLYLFNDEIDEMEACVKSNIPEKIGEQLPKLHASIDEMRDLFKQNFQNKLSQKDFEFITSGGSQRTEEAALTRLPRKERYVMNIGIALNELSEKIQKIKDANDFIVNGIEGKILLNLVQNFQISKLSSLSTRRDKCSRVFIDGVGKFELENNQIGFSIEQTGLQKLQDYSRVIYLESPIYWKLKSALEDIRVSPRFFHSPGRVRISGVPGYFYDLVRALRIDYVGESTFSKLFQRLISSEVIGGKITLSENGELSFDNEGRNFSLHLTAMGVINLGILALLIERKILDEGAFLFIDEPEAHLHPAWQVIMAETLFELAKGGVNVVIATHSADILKWLEVHVKKNPDDQELVALNQFSVGNRALHNEGMDFRDKMQNIKQELTKPFADLYTAGL